MPREHGHVTIDGRRLEVTRHGTLVSGHPALVFLHQGLGSVTTWRDFPDALAARTGLPAIVYSRLGHGASDARAEPPTTRFMHDEALTILPRLLRALEVDDPILVGHSDGGSIALIYAGAAAGPVRGLALEAPHVFVEDVSVRSIEAARAAFEEGGLRARLERYHGPNTDSAFRAWNDVWLSPGFRSWNILEYVRRVTVPTLVVQGLADEYGTVRQVDAIVDASRGTVETLLLEGCGHDPHRARRVEVLDAMTRFVGGLLDGAHP